MRDSLFHFAEFGALINFVAFHGLFGDFGHFDRLSHFAKKNCFHDVREGFPKACRHRNCFSHNWIPTSADG